VFILSTGVSRAEQVVTGWPLKLASPPDCHSDCVTAESVVGRPDTVAGFPAYTETGLVSGGEAGWRRTPMFVSSWTVSATERGTAQAWSSSRAMLDTLLMVLHSAQPGRLHAEQPPN
jgi:hypothetical protein